MELHTAMELFKKSTMLSFALFFLGTIFPGGKLPHPITLTGKIRELVNLPDSSVLYQLGYTAQYFEVK